MVSHSLEGEHSIGPETVKRCRCSEMDIGHGLPAWKSSGLSWMHWSVQLDRNSRSRFHKNVQKFLAKILSSNSDDIRLSHPCDAWTQQGQKMPWEEFTSSLLQPCFISRTDFRKQSTWASLYWLLIMKANSSLESEKCFCKTFLKNLIKFPVNSSRTVVGLNGQMGFASFIDHTCQILNTLVLWPSWVLQSILIYYLFLAGFWCSIHKKLRHYLNFPGIRRSYLFLI